MTRVATARLALFAVLTAASLVACRPGKRTPIDERPSENEVDEQYLSGYVEPRAYPDSVLDPVHRVAAFRILDSTRVALKRPHLPSIWWNSVPETAPSTPGDSICGWYSLGPTNMSGRVTDIAIDAGNSNRMFVATVGGIWRSLDGGRRWQCVTLEIEDGTFGCVAISRSDSDTVFAGGGDPNHGLGHEVDRADGFGGTGLWVSGAGGEPGTWQMVAPDLTGKIIFRVLIDPGHGHEVYAATNAGVYVGTRVAAGMSWTILHDFTRPACDLAADFTSTPPVLYAACYRAADAHLLGLWRHDTSWTPCNDGIPADKAGAISLTLCDMYPNVLYASIENRDDGSLLGIFRTRTGAKKPSTGGPAWERLPVDGPDDWAEKWWWYTNVIRVDPANPDRVLLGALDLGWAANAGSGFTHWEDVDRSTATGYDDPMDYLSAIVHDDVHAIAFLPGNSRAVVIGSDGGVNRCGDITSPMRRWENISHGLNITEVYSLSTQPGRGSIVCAGAQDVGQMVTMGNMVWYGSHTDDIFSVAMDTQNPCLVYGADKRKRSDLSPLGLTVNPVLGTGRYGEQAPLNDDAVPVYPVVTDADQTGQAIAGGIVGDRQVLLSTTDHLNWTEVPNFGSLGADQQIWSLAIGHGSSFQAFYAGIRGVGTSQPDVRLAATMDGGSHWSVVQVNVPNLLPNQIAVDWNDFQRAFVAFGGRRGREGAVAVTTDGGVTWDTLAPIGSFSISEIATLGVAIDPYDSQVIYAATDIGVFRGVLSSLTATSVTWAPFDEGLPNGLRCSVMSVIHDAGLLCLATYGHGVYQRNLDAGVSCTAKRLLVRDNVLDTGWGPTFTGVPDPEDPIDHPIHAWACSPNSGPGGEIHWWCSTDIRTEGSTTTVPPQNVIMFPDNVEFEACPKGVSICPPGTMIDSDPACDDQADVHVQILNRGRLPVANVRVVALWCSPTPHLPSLPSDFWTVTFPAGSSVCGPLSGGTPWMMVDAGQTIPIVNPGFPEVVHFDWDLPPAAKQHSCILVLTDAIDDPLEPDGEINVGVLASGDRHVAVRNLHILSCASKSTGRVRSLALNGARNLRISQSTGKTGGGITLLLPELSNAQMKGLERVPRRLTPELLEFARRWKLDTSAVYIPRNDVSAIIDIPRTDSEARIGIVTMDPDEKSRGAANVTRFSIVAVDSGRVTGGNTFLVRR